ncbi:TonB-dependent receptor plug domain-containing protein [candidate division KSB1 bacterium]|nr:TonB-dependent receptor plug domain-containing protein [candidate division KSB1 bacterium]
MAFLIRLTLSLILAGIFPMTVFGIQDDPDSTNILDLPIERLLNLEVVVSTPLKKNMKLHEATTAIFVLTGDEIQRSGYRSIPEALRLVPGIQVARIDANKWAVSSRGFNGIFTNKLLVLIDGRSVYTPLFSGVFWDSQDILMEDIDRIEVIRGPGASTWGANAVNGVVNVITKHSRQTQNGFLHLGFGSEEPGFGELRYGDKFGEYGTYRVYSKFNRRNNLVRLDGTPGADRWHTFQNGFRADWNISDADFLSMQGDVAFGTIGQMYSVIQQTPTLNFMAYDGTATTGIGNVIGRWEHDFSNTNNTILQCYIDHYQRDDVTLSGKINTYDIDFLHNLTIGEYHQIIWGTGYRFTQDDLDNTNVMWFTPSAKTTSILSMFVQDEIKLYSDRFHMTLGSKFERNDYTGWEIQPNIRMHVQLSRNQTLWAAVSRAVRTRSRAEDGLHAYTDVIQLPLNHRWWLSMNGTESFKSEELLSHEIGYRNQISSRIFMDVALFYNKYDHLRTYEPNAFKAGPVGDNLNFEIPLFFSNNMYGNSRGGEIVIDFSLTNWWRIYSAYSYLRIKMYLDEAALAKNPLYPYIKATPIADLAKGTEGESPRHQFVLHQSLEISDNLHMDAFLRYVDTLLKLDVPSYINADISFHWQYAKNLGFSVVGQNLLHTQVMEWDPSYAQISGSLNQRGLYGSVQWSF